MRNRRYSNLNEGVSGELAKALKLISDFNKKKLIQGLRDQDIDFNRSIGDAIKLKSNRDPRLKDPDNIIIGVFDYELINQEMEYGMRTFKGSGIQTGIAAYDVENGHLVKFPYADEFIVPSIDRTRWYNLPEFSKLSWKRWIDCMREIYIIKKSEAAKISSLGRNRTEESWRLRGSRLNESRMNYVEADMITSTVHDWIKEYGTSFSVAYYATDPNYRGYRDEDGEVEYDDAWDCFVVYKGRNEILRYDQDTRRVKSSGSYGKELADLLKKECSRLVR